MRNKSSIDLSSLRAGTSLILLVAALVAACSDSGITAPRLAPDFSVQSVTAAEAQSLPPVAVAGGVGTVVVTGIVVAPDPPCATSISADDQLAGRTLTVRIISTVPGRGAGTCAVMQGGPNYAYTATSHNVPAGTVRVIVRYVVTDGQVGTTDANSGTVKLDQNVIVQ